MGVGGSSQGYSYIATAQWYLEGARNYGRGGFERAAATFTPLPESLRGLTFVVTGANSGLGYATALELARRHADVHLVCRSQARGEAALAQLRAATASQAAGTLHIVDLSSVAQVKAFGAAWEARQAPLHGLVLNAGYIARERELTADGLEASWATAMLQSYLLTGLLMPALLRAGASPGASGRAPPARVIHVSSGGGLTVRCDVAGIHAAAGLGGARFDGTLQYAHSKRAQMLLAQAWAARAPPQVAVAAMHPGWADTEGVRSALPEFREQRKGSLRSEAQGADTAVWLAAAPALPPGAGGQLFFDRAAVPQHYPLAGTASSPADVEALWEACASYCNWRP
jgi:dehydrogenase/reductase SDR family protein 12